MEEVDKKLKDYITTHDKKFDLYFINCDFKIEFDNNFTTSKQTNFFNNIENNIKSSLLYQFECFKSRRYAFYKINQMTINSISDRCNMTYQHYINQPMCMCEPQINLKVAKSPQLINSLGPIKNHPLIRKCSHISLNN